MIGHRKAWQQAQLRGSRLSLCVCWRVGILCQLAFNASKNQ